MLQQLGKAVLLAGMLALTGCRWGGSPKPSFLVIAVENLGADALDCSTASGGIADLCNNAVRFTHAYTTSILSQAALASILTGLYPLDNHVEQNGNDYLSEKYTTVSYAAYRAGYRTAFFSGGPPIWRKSGLAKGFEVFDDDVIPTADDLYRPFGESSKLFFRWLKTGRKNRPFFGVIYVPDLQFALPAPYKIQAEVENAINPQFDYFKNTLSSLILRLKKMGIWRTTNVVVVGLNGVPDEDRGEVDTLDLFSENTHIFFLFKSAHKDRNQGNSWPIDANVSLADLGATLFKLLHVPKRSSNFKYMTVPAVSLTSALKGPTENWSNNQIIPIESAWAKWRGYGRTRYAFRLRNLLYLDDRSPEVYDSLVDRFEAQPISPSNPSVRRAAIAIQRFIAKHRIKPFDPLSTSLHDKFMVAEDTFSEDGSYGSTGEELKRLAEERPHDLDVGRWQAWRAVREQNWTELKKLGKKYRKLTWTYVARRQLNEPAVLPNNSCLKMLRIFSSENAPEESGPSCEDREFISFAKWVNNGSLLPNLLGDRFFREFEMAELLNVAIRKNYSEGLPWDTSTRLTNEPTLVNLVLTLPEFRFFRQILIDQLQEK